MQELISSCGVININLDDDGTVQIESYTKEALDKCEEAVMKIVVDGVNDKGRKGRKEPEGPPPEIGVIYRECEVKGVHAFGVFVEILPGYEGLVHISELDIKKVTNPAAAGIQEGQRLDVKFLGKNEKGQMRLSRRQVLMRDSSEKKSAENNGGDNNSTSNSV